MRRWQALAIVGVALVALGASWVASFAGAVTPIVYSYEPTSGPGNTFMTMSVSGCTGSSGAFALELNPANPMGLQQMYTPIADGSSQQLRVPTQNFILGGPTSGFYNIRGQCSSGPFDPTYSPCGFTVTSSPGVSGRCNNVGGLNPTVVFTPRFAASDEALATAAASKLGIPLPDLSRQAGYFVAFLRALHVGPLLPIAPPDNTGPFTLPAEYPANVTVTINNLSAELGVTPDQFHKAAVTLVVFLASV